MVLWRLKSFQVREQFFLPCKKLKPKIYGKDFQNIHNGIAACDVFL